MFCEKKSATAEIQPADAKPQLKRDPGKLADKVKMHIVNELKGDPSYTWRLHVLSQQFTEGEDIFKFRVYCEAKAEAKQVKVDEYASLDKYQGLIEYQGTCNTTTWQIQFDDISPDQYASGAHVKIFTEEEIQRTIEDLTEPGSSTFFYLGGSPATGGPLGRGAAVIELNPNYPAKKQQKFLVYAADVNGTEINGNKIFMFQSSETSDLARWIKERRYIEQTRLPSAQLRYYTAL